MFKIRCSQISKIMGPIGLTDLQKVELAELEARESGNGKPLTAKQAETLEKLRNKPSDLPAGAISYLKEWYAEQLFNDGEEIYSKYTDKGNMCEAEAIDMIAENLGYCFLDKNEEHLSNSFLTGTPDIITENYVLDAKCPFNGKTFLEACTGKLNNDYWWQMQGYMALTGLMVAKVCYCLIDTPEDCNYGRAVSYQSAPYRFKAFHVDRDEGAITAIANRVAMCNEWLKKYELEVQNAFSS